MSKKVIQKKESQDNIPAERMNIQRYLRKYGSGINVYIQAYLKEKFREGKFRDIIKSKVGWEKTINGTMEG